MVQIHDGKKPVEKPCIHSVGLLSLNMRENTYLILHNENDFRAHKVSKLNMTGQKTNNKLITLCMPMGIFPLEFYEN